jgi:hypothetical protein
VTYDQHMVESCGDECKLCGASIERGHSKCDECLREAEYDRQEERGIDRWRGVDD